MNVFDIYIERLRGGKTLEIDEVVDPSFIDVKEADLSFQDPVVLKGQASLAEGALVVHLHVETYAKVPCSICNQEIKFNIKLDDLFIVEELINIKSGIFNFKDDLREEILLEVPPTAECNEGACEDRASVAKFLRKKTVDAANAPTYQPFIDL
jgi:uncharacterized metal-binding protein YceD (DUF177 family)